ncbi:MAG: DUF4870 domain-containing protein [Nocardioidaceae bacterium]|nr:DUF4870 domain-containing protein [Nocardioidaceae bacterium]
MSDSMPPPEGQPEGQQPPQPGDVPPPPPAYGQAPPGQPGYPAAGYGQPTYGQPTYGQPTYGAPAPGMLSPADERTWGAGAHWSALVALLIGLPFLGPLLVLLIYGNKSAWVRRQAVESLNFQLSMIIYAIVSAILIIVLIGFFLLLAVGALSIIMPIVAAVKVNNGEDFRYPITIRMVS